MARLLQPAEFVGEGSVAGRLYDLGRYPGLVPPRAPHDRVRGEVYRLLKPKLTLVRLDGYEGCQPRGAPAEYARKRLTVRLDDGRQLTAWAYRYNGEVAHAGYIASGDYRQAQGLVRTWPHPRKCRK